VLTPVVWEYRHRVEGWPSGEFDQRRMASAAGWMANPGRDPRVSERIDEFMARRR
jgi:hypothetical protein